MKDYYRFPKNFVWGSANASYQVEGAANEDGRGPSVWDTFCKKPGRVQMDHNGDVASDMYHRYKGDVQLMKDLGLKAYRFSTAWPRIFPKGYGKPNPKGMAYYDRLVDELLKHDIEPWITLFHWDLPQALEDEFGGWTSRETVKHFADYSAYVVTKLSDRVKNWFTINEFGCFLDMAYCGGDFAPGAGKPHNILPSLRHNGVLAHGMCAQAIRANTKQKGNVGISQDAAVCIPVWETPENIAAAKTAYRVMNASSITVMMEGKYPDFYLQDCGADMPVVTDEELKIISTPLDFVGINMYWGRYFQADPAARHGYREITHPAAYPKMPGGINLCPSNTYWTPRMLKELWGVKAVYITENGSTATDKVERNGEILDTDRIFYLRQHFMGAHRAVSEGWPLKGYFVWSFLDNFEWMNGYTQRYGLIYVNYQTLERTRKLSSRYYQEVIRRNAVV